MPLLRSMRHKLFSGRALSGPAGGAYGAPYRLVWGGVRCPLKGRITKGRGVER